jgi:tetratricopeptide (TPR) repeat protein
VRNFLKVFFLFFIVGLLVFFNGLNNKFLMDDFEFLKSPFMSSPKFMLSQWDPYSTKELGILENYQGTHPYYRPLTHMLYDVCYAVFKNHFWQYHLLNILLLAACAALFFILIWKLSANYNLAFLAGLLYLVHPINGIIVNYISANVFGFQVICMTATILLLLQSLERNNDKVLYALSLFFSFLSLFWHESGVLTPLYLATVVLLFRKEPLKEKALYLSPYFLILLSYFVFRFFFFSINQVLEKPIVLKWFEYPANVFQAFQWYIVQLFYPSSVVIEWAAPITHQHTLLNNLGLFSIFFLFTVMLFKFHQEKICQLAALWVLIGFISVYKSVFRVPHAGVVIEPHWFIFSSIGIFILAAHYCLILVERMKKIGLILLIVLLIGLGIVSHLYNDIWRDQKTYNLFWADEVPTLDAPFTYLALSYQKEGNFKEARKYIALSLAREPYGMDDFNNLGVMDQMEGNWKGAEKDYKLALLADPFSASTYCNLGTVYSSRRQWKKAQEYFLKSLSYNNLLVEPRRGLARIDLIHGQYREAIALCLKNLDIISDDRKTLLLLVDIFNKEKDSASLKKYAYRYINVENDANVLTAFGVEMGQKNMPDLAMDSFTKAIHLAPDDRDAYLATGTLLANLGQFDQAIHIWQIGSGIDATDGRFKDNIALAIKLKANHSS